MDTFEITITISLITIVTHYAYTISKDNILFSIYILHIIAKGYDSNVIQINYKNMHTIPKSIKLTWIINKTYKLH